MPESAVELRPVVVTSSDIPLCGTAVAPPSSAEGGASPANRETLEVPSPLSAPL